MTALSPRWTLAVLCLAALTALPIWVHTRGLRDADPCRDPGAFKAALLIPGSQPEREDRKPHPREIQYSVGDIEGEKGVRAPLRFAIVRSFDPTSLTNRPARFAIPKLEVQSRELRWIQRDGKRLPIHWVVEDARSHEKFVAYYFVYQGRPVESPTLAIMASGLGRLWGGARPLTLVAVGGHASKLRIEATRQRAEQWLFATWDHYGAVCAP